MSGHSHWSNIQHKKGKEDAKRGKLFSKLSSQIIRAAQGGGSDPEFNIALRNAIESAKKANMPQENIKRAVVRGGGQGGSVLEKQTLEGYGPSGVAFLIRTETDNKNRTLSLVRSIFVKHGGSLGEAGCSAYVFGENGVPQFEVELADDVGAQVQAMVDDFGAHPDVVGVFNNAVYV